ncbi:hypothetical protein AAZX31_13G002700 [Glycine max]
MKNSIKIKIYVTLIVIRLFVLKEKATLLIDLGNASKQNKQRKLNLVTITITIVPILLTPDNNFPNLFMLPVVERDFLTMRKIAFFKELIPRLHNIFFANSNIKNNNIPL